MKVLPVLAAAAVAAATAVVYATAFHPVVKQRGELAAQLSELQKTNALLEAQIAELRRKATDTRNDPATRAEAEAKARELVNYNYDKQIQLAKAMSIIQVEMDKEAGNTFEETKHTEETKQRILDLDTQRAQAIQGLDKLENRIASSASATASAAQKAREEMQKMAEVQAKWAGLGSVSTAGINPAFPGVITPTESIIPQSQADRWVNALRAQFGDITIGVRFKANTDDIVNITNEVTSLMESGVARAGELIGNLVGTLAGGGDAWGDFKSAALAAFGDMAIAVGKIAISMGVAAAGIDVALKDTGQWYVAVAAGAALVALGAAVKSSLSAVASGDYSAGGGGYSGSYSGGSSNSWDTREVTVNVTGTLEADGDKLITVINNAHRKNYYTQ